MDYLQYVWQHDYHKRKLWSWYEASVVSLATNEPIKLHQWVVAIARYPASAEDLDVTISFLVLHEMGAPPKRSK